MDLSAEKTFILSIIQQAIVDACEYGMSCDKRSALNFLKEDNKLLDYYCTLIDIDPSYIIRMFKIIFNKNEEKRTERLRKIIFDVDRNYNFVHSNKD